MQRSGGKNTHSLFLECKSVHATGSQRVTGKVMSKEVRGEQTIEGIRSLDFTCRATGSLQRAFSMKGFML